MTHVNSRLVLELRATYNLRFAFAISFACLNGEWRLWRSGGERQLRLCAASFFFTLTSAIVKVKVFDCALLSADSTAISQYSSTLRPHSNRQPNKTLNFFPTFCCISQL
jgi:hypothetical protein